VTTQALILAGGLGTRLGVITREIPKPMVPIGDKPFLEHLLVYLLDHGIKKFVLCVGYRAPQIQEYFGNGKKWNCEIVHSLEEKPLGTGGAIKNAARFLEDTFLVINGDNYLKLDHQTFIRTFQRMKHKVGMLACRLNDPSFTASNLNLNEKSRVIEAYDYQNPEGMKYVDCGVKIFSRRLLDFFGAEDSFSLEIDTLPKIVRKSLLAGYLIKEPALDIGTPENLQAASEVFLHRGKNPTTYAKP